jgi:hypothetical protein
MWSYITALWSLNTEQLKIVYHILDNSHKLSFFFLAFSTPRPLPKCERNWFWKAANTWLMTGTVYDRKQQTPHSNATFTKATKIQLHVHACWTYTKLNFTYLPDDHAEVWTPLCLVMDCTEEHLSLVCESHSETYVNVLRNAWGVLPLFTRKSNPCVCCVLLQKLWQESMCYSRIRE